MRTFEFQQPRLSNGIPISSLTARNGRASWIDAQMEHLCSAKALDLNHMRAYQLKHQYWMCLLGQIVIDDLKTHQSVTGLDMIHVNSLSPGGSLGISNRAGNYPWILIDISPIHREMVYYRYESEIELLKAASCPTKLERPMGISETIELRKDAYFFAINHSTCQAFLLDPLPGFTVR
jgi:hypothetical protein